MGALAALSLALLVAAATGAYRVFSYLAAALLVGAVAAASIERNDREFDVAPYNGLAVGWAAVFVVGFTGIWLLWDPSVTTYEYVLGLPTATLVYVVCIWLLPILGAFYYAFVFDDVGDDDIVDGIMADARAVQRGRALPLSGDPIADADGGGEPPADTTTDGSGGER